MLAACAACVATAAPGFVESYRLTIDAALRAGDPAVAADTLARARQRFPDDPDLRAWSAVVEQIHWRDLAALDDLRELERRRDYGTLGREEIMGRIGELLFAIGSYAESRPFLTAGGVGTGADRRLALARVTRDLPRSRRALSDLAAELPLRGGPLPELLCRIGARQRPFVLDTGASFTTITRSLARDLGVIDTIDAGLGRDGIGQSFPVAFAVVQDFGLGRIELGDIPVVVVADQHLAMRDTFGEADVRPLGVVGLDVLARFRVSFDPERESVVFELPRGLDAVSSVECVQYGGNCLVPVQVEGRRLWFVLDTGASHSSLTGAGVLALPGGDRRAVDAYRRVRSPGGTQHVVRRVPGLTLTIAQLRFAGVDLPVVLRPPSGLFPVHGVLGVDLLLACRTTFDRGRLRLQPR